MAGLITDFSQRKCDTSAAASTRLHITHIVLTGFNPTTVWLPAGFKTGHPTRSCQRTPALSRLTWRSLDLMRFSPRHGLRSPIIMHMLLPLLNKRFNNATLPPSSSYQLLFGASGARQCRCRLASDKQDPRPTASQPARSRHVADALGGWTTFQMVISIWYSALHCK